MGSNNQYEHQKYWEEQEEKFREQLNKDCEVCNIDTSIPIGDGIIYQIERGPVQTYKDFDNLPEELKIAYEMIFGKDFINKIYKTK